MEVVAVLGASSDEGRYSNKALRMLKEYGHKTVSIHPRETEILGEKVYSDVGALNAAGEKVDTLTMYVNAAISSKYEKDILALRPKRVIFNPGSENPHLESALRQKGIKVEEACTLVMLRTDQF